jgi:dienelactone hydrolase
LRRLAGKCPLWFPAASLATAWRLDFARGDSSEIFMKAWLAAIATPLLCASALAQTARPLPPVEAFGNLPFISGPELSPDGKHFVAIQDVRGKPAAVVYTLFADKNAAPQVFMDHDPRLTVTGAFWVKDGKLVVFSKGESFEWTSSLGTLFSLDGTDQITLGTIWGPQSIADKDPDDPNFFFLPIRNYITGTVYVEKIDIPNRRGSIAGFGRALPTRWILDGHGNVVGRVERFHDPLTDELFLYRNGVWKDPIKFDAHGDLGADVAGVSNDSKSLVLFGHGDRQSLTLLDIATGRNDTTLYSNPQFDINLVRIDEWTGRVIGGEYVSDMTHIDYFDPAHQALQRGIEAAFPNTNASLASVDIQGDRVIVLASAPRLPPTYYYLDRQTHQASKVASEYPSLTPDDLGEMKPYPYKARDGLEIPAYITFPPGREGAKNLPLIVLPHEHIEARDSEDFDWIAQFLANRGYVVLQPNYRGSFGYGRAFTDAGLHQLGLKMQDDITDGVKKAIADGIADPKRVCIVGVGFGGYAALAGATFTPDVYACAASFDGATDLSSLLVRLGAHFGDISTSPASYWISRIGDLSDDSAQLDATSPVQHAQNVKAPILLMQAEKNTFVPLYEAENERDALQKAGKSVEFVRFDGDDHLTLAATRIGMLTHLEKFLHDHIGN